MRNSRSISWFEKGATLAEYALLVALIAVVAIVCIKLVGRAVQCRLVETAAITCGKLFREEFGTGGGNKCWDTNKDGNVDGSDFMQFRYDLTQCPNLINHF